MHEEKDMDNQRVWIKYTNYTFFSGSWFIGVKVVKAACEEGMEYFGPIKMSHKVFSLICWKC